MSRLFELPCLKVIIDVTSFRMEEITTVSIGLFVGIRKITKRRLEYFSLFGSRLIIRPSYG